MKADQSASSQLSGARVLLIEGDESTLELYERRLRSFGVSLARASTAEEWLKRLRQEEFDLLILDPSLPASVHGVEVLRDLETERIDLPIVIITSHADLDPARRVMPYPVSSYHLKGPDTLERLPEILVSALQSFELRRARAEAQRERSRLEFFLDRSGWLYVFVDSAGRMQEVNRATAGAFGVSEKQFVGRPFWELLHPALHDEAKARWPELLDGTMAPQPWLVTHKRADGESITVEWSYTPYEGARGEVRGVIAFGRVVTERREAELRARVLFEEALTGIAMIDQKTMQIVEINMVGAAYFGLDAGSMKGRLLTGLFATDDQKLFDRKVDQLRKSSDSATGEARATRADGTKFTLGYRASRIVQGSRPLVVLLCRDVSELREMENKYRELFHRSLTPIFLVDSATAHLEDCNVAFERLVGRPREELIGFDVFDILEPAERDRVQVLIESQIETDASVEFETTLLRSDGSQKFIEARTSSFDFAGRAHHITFIRDLTGEKQAADRYERMFLHGYDPIVILDESMIHAVDANPAFLELSGYSREDLRRLQRRDFLEDSKVGERSTDGRLMAMLTTKSGEKVPISYRHNELRVDDSASSMLTVHDLRSELRAQELERSLTQFQKMQALGQMASGIAHDFNNTLMAALPWADLLRRKYPNDETIQKSADQIRRAVHRAKDVTRQLLDFAQPRLPERKRVNLAEHLRSEMKILRPSLPPEVAIDLRIDDGEFVVNADPAQLSQILLNLALNARDAMQGGGSLTFELRKPTEAEAIRWSIIPDRSALLAVRDTGTGIDEATLAKIFDPFYTTKDIGHGAGLGLSVVLRLIEQHGGKIHVESDHGRGSTFYVLFPLSEVGNVEVPAPEPAMTPSTKYGGLKVLLIDDEVSISEGIKMLLEAEGAKVMTATRGLRALELLEEGLRPDFIILDLGLPEMPGQQVHSAIRQTLPDVPVLVASGYGDPERVGALLRDENTHFQQKPYEIASLFREIDWFLARKRRAR
ncbi:MAG TPA: PAS domain S-box protein [Thermoanaerobaculia bacterium]